jgi:hypothetical protein
MTLRPLRTKRLHHNTDQSAAVTATLPTRWSPRPHRSAPHFASAWTERGDPREQFERRPSGSQVFLPGYMGTTSI